MASLFFFLTFFPYSSKFDFIKERLVHYANTHRDLSPADSVHLELPCWHEVRGHFVEALSRGVEMEAARNKREWERELIDELEE